MKVAIATPSGTLVHANFAMSLAGMTGSSDYPIVLINPKSSNICMSRNRAVEEARTVGCDWLLFIDSDMSFPTYSLNRLMNEALTNNKDILGCNYVARQFPHRSLVRGMGNVEQIVSGITEVERLPTGFLLIRMSVFDQLKKPYFMFTVNEEAEIGTEDYYFCDKVREVGFKIWMDTELSLSMVHWGDIGCKWSENKEGYEQVKS